MTFIERIKARIDSYVLGLLLAAEREQMTLVDGRLTRLHRQIAEHERWLATLSAPQVSQEARRLAALIENTRAMITNLDYELERRLGSEELTIRGEFVDLRQMFIKHLMQLHNIDKDTALELSTYSKPGGAVGDESIRPDRNGRGVV